jgi:hypothetical protein
MGCVQLACNRRCVSATDWPVRFVNAKTGQAVHSNTNDPARYFGLAQEAEEHEAAGESLAYEAQNVDSALFARPAPPIHH